MIKNRICPAKKLEQLIRKLVRVSILKLESITFLKSLHKAFYMAKKGVAILDDTCINDLKL